MFFIQYFANRRFYACFLLLVLACYVSQARAQVTERYQFDIQAQSVSKAIVEFALQRELNLAFLAQLTGDKRANAVIGEYGLDEALDILLAGTGLSATISNNSMIQIRRLPAPKPTPAYRTSVPKAKAPVKVVQQAQPENPAPLPIETVLVVAKLLSPYNLGTTVSSTKTQRDFLDTPQIVNALPQQLARDIAARTYADSTLLASSASYLERSAGVADELRLRGFAYPALKINGIGAHAYIAPVDIAFIDRIEIAKGPSSVLFGRMEPGGIINMMLKQAGQMHNRLLLRHGTDSFSRAELDIGGSVSEQSEIRAIGFVQRRGSEQSLDLDDSEGAMLAFNYRLANGATINAHYRYESQEVLQQFGRPLEGFDSSVEIFRDENGDLEIIAPRQQDLRSGLNVDRNSVYLSMNDWLISDWSADLNLQYDQYQANSLVRFPIIEDFVIDFNGEQIDTDELTDALLENEDFLEALTEGLETVSVDDDNIFFEDERFAYDTRFFSAELTLYNQRQLRGALSAWELEQLYGLNINDSKPETLVWQTHDTRSSFLPLGQAEFLFNADDLQSEVRDKNAGIFAQWALNSGDFTTFLGVRIDYLKFSANRLIDALDEEFSEPLTQGISEDFIEPTFRLGAIYRLGESSSLFFNYSQAFSPQFSLQEIPSSANFAFFPEPIVTVDFPDPAESAQIEIGIKRSWLDDRLQSSCALYQIEKDRIVADIAKQRSRGLECDLVGSLGHGWHLTAGLSLLDAEILASEEAELVGRRPRMTPEQSLRLWLSKDITLSHNWQSRAGIGYSYVDERYITAENYDVLEAYNLVELGFTFDYQDRLSASFLVRNLLDEDFTQGVFNALPFWTNPGQGRTIETRLAYWF